MDPIRRYNERRWAALVRAQALFTRPVLDLEPASALDLVDPERRLPDLEGRSVLCLASGGGKQSLAFALLGARVTVVDLCEAQLETDRAAAIERRVSIETVHADMRDLSAFSTASFDGVYQPYSLNFVDDPDLVFRQVARVLRPRGWYHVAFANPTALGVSSTDWTGAGYPIRADYHDPGPVDARDESWVFREGPPDSTEVPPPREYRHTWSRVVNALAGNGFAITHVSEPRPGGDEDGPGTWPHFARHLPPWFELWTRLLPANG